MERTKKEAIQQDYKALLEEVQNPVKDTAGYEGRYFYKQLPEMLTDYKPLIAKHNFVLTNRTEGDVLYVELLHTSGEKISSWANLIQEQNAQKFGSYQTYMRRYQLMLILNIAGEDDDGEKTVEKAVKPAPKYSQKSSQNVPTSDGIPLNGTMYHNKSGVGSKTGKAFNAWFPDDKTQVIYWSKADLDKAIAYVAQADAVADTTGELGF